MLLKIIIFSFTLIFLTLSSEGLATSSISQPVMICNDGQWPPYGYLSKDGKSIGISIDVITAIFQRENIRFKVITLPWKRCLHYVEIGKYHLVTDASINEKRLKAFIVSDVIYDINHGLFYQKNKFSEPSFKTIDALEQYSIGGILGYNFSIYNFDTSKVDQSSTDAENLLAMLRFGRHDFVIGYVEIFQAMERANVLSLEGLDWVVIPETTSLSFHMMLSKKADKKLMEIINVGLKRMVEDGSYQDIIDNYY
ncbi:MAG: transporter substrate-binding domain-containing protein [Colwellia sp.]|nr:transporter substrate-binding domain-containing protein [Colwellia sp.]